MFFLGAVCASCAHLVATIAISVYAWRRRIKREQVDAALERELTRDERNAELDEIPETTRSR